MRAFSIHKLAWPSALALVFSVASLEAGAATMLASPDDFGGTEKVVTFDGMTYATGEVVSHVDGVDFRLTSGTGPKFRADFGAREFGPTGAGSVDNVKDHSVPFPDLTMTLPEVCHRMSFELRTELADDIGVTLKRGGVVVDQFTLTSKGPYSFGFHGFENMEGFDEVVVNVAANVAGAFVLDNVRVETIGTADPPPAAIDDGDKKCKPKKERAVKDGKRPKKVKKGCEE